MDMEVGTRGMEVGTRGIEVGTGGMEVGTGVDTGDADIGMVAMDMAPSAIAHTLMAGTGTVGTEAMVVATIQAIVTNTHHTAMVAGTPPAIMATITATTRNTATAGTVIRVTTREVTTRAVTTRAVTIMWEVTTTDAMVDMAVNITVNLATIVATVASTTPSITISTVTTTKQNPQLRKDVRQFMKKIDVKEVANYRSIPQYVINKV